MRRTLALLAAAPLLLAASTDPAARARLDALNAREAALSAKIDANRAELVKLLSALETLRRDPPPALLVKPDRARDAARAAILLRAITPELQRRARLFSAQAAELNKVRREAAEAGAALFADESAAADPGAPKRPRPGDLAPPPAAQAAPPAKAGVGPGPQRLAAPVPGDPVRRFGAVEPGRPRSEGLAWAVAPGAAVVAPAAGEVEFAGPLRGQGLVVVLRLDGGWRAVISGLGKIVTPVGARVRAGERLGEATAMAGEVRLQLRRGAEPVDPGPPLTR